MKDDLTIPTFLRRKPPTAEQIAKLEELNASILRPELKLAAPGTINDLMLKPKGMSIEEWEQVKQRRKKENKMPDEAKEMLRAKKKAGKPVRPSRDGLVSIGVIAKEMGLIPREARAILRSIKMVKPACGWAWTSGEVDGIKKALDDGRKAAAAKPSKAGGGGKKKRIVIPPAGEDTDWALSKKERKRWKKKGREQSAIEAEKALEAEKLASASKPSAKSKAAQARASKSTPAKAPAARGKSTSASSRATRSKSKGSRKG